MKLFLSVNNILTAADYCGTNLDPGRGRKENRKERRRQQERKEGEEVTQEKGRIEDVKRCE